MSLDMPMGGSIVAGAIAKTLEGLSICPGRVEPRDAIKEAEEHGGHVLLSDQSYFQENFLGVHGRTHLIEGQVKTIKDESRYAFRHKGSKEWTTLNYSNLQELFIKKDF